MALSRGDEDLGHIGGLGHRKRHRGDAEPAVVVDEVDDLDGGPITQGPLRHVGLPGLIGQLGREADEARPWPLLGLRHHEAPSLEHPPDRAERRDVVVAAPQVPVDRHRPGVETLLGQLLAQQHDLTFELARQRRGRGAWPSRPRRQAGLALGSVAGQQLVDPAAVDAMRLGQLGHPAPFPQVRLDQIPPQLHRNTPRLGVSYVLTQVSPMSWDPTPPAPHMGSTGSVTVRRDAA